MTNADCIITILINLVPQIVKKSQFPLRRKRASTDYAQEELLCPLDLCVFPYGRSDSVGQVGNIL